MESLTASADLQTTDDLGDGEAEPQGGDGKMGALKPQGGKAQKKTETRSPHGGQEKGGGMMFMCFFAGILSRKNMGTIQWYWERKWRKGSQLVGPGAAPGKSAVFKGGVRGG